MYLVFLLAIPMFFQDFTGQFSSKAIGTKELVSSEIPKKEIILCYCPTMHEKSQGIKSENDAIVLKGFGSTAQAFRSLNEKTVDAVLVGRLFEEGELDNPHELRLRSGFTLAGRSKRFIGAEELKAIRIHTAADEEIAGEYLPGSQNIIFHDSISSAIEEGINDAILISWEDFPESDLSLVIPVDSRMNKVERFRIPVVYSYEKEILSSLASYSSWHNNLEDAKKI